MNPAGAEVDHRLESQDELTRLDRVVQPRHHRDLLAWRQSPDIQRASGSIPESAATDREPGFGQHSVGGAGVARVERRTDRHRQVDLLVHAPERNPQQVPEATGDRLCHLGDVGG